MSEELIRLEKKREILNELVKDISILDYEEKKFLQQISEEVDKLILNYIKNYNNRL